VPPVLSAGHPLRCGPGCTAGIKDQAAAAAAAAAATAQVRGRGRGAVTAAHTAAHQGISQNQSPFQAMHKTNHDNAKLSGATVGFQLLDRQRAVLAQLLFSTLIKSYLTSIRDLIPYM
jgi:hypothetical protein